MYQGIQDSLWSNRFKSFLLLILFPLILFLALFLFFYITSTQVGFKLCGYYKTIKKTRIPENFRKRMSKSQLVEEKFSLKKCTINEAFFQSLNIFYYVIPIIAIWGIISFLFHRQLIFKFSGAKPITRKENPEIYNIVENLCISRGLRTPNIGVIEDKSMNAFTTGWSTNHARIVFSRGLIDKLDEKEIQAVAAHELTHVINNDSLLMIIVVVYIGIITTLGEVILRMASGNSGGNNKGKLPFLILGGLLLAIGYLVYPFIQMALSRKREYLADAGSVKLTKEKYAMISALKKISGDPVIESIDKRGVGAMCIDNPFEEKRKNKKSIFKKFKSLFSTHPSVEDRIKALQSY